MEKISVADIVGIIGPNAKIGLGNACAEPQTLIEALIDNRERFKAIEVYGFINYWHKRFIEHQYGGEI